MAIKRGGAEVTNQTLLWGGLWGLAALLRLVSLGWPPLGDAEAALALSAAKGGLASPFWHGASGLWGAPPTSR